MADLRRRTETILVLAATDYQFTYHSPSLLAASAIMTALQSLSLFNSIQSDNSQSTFNEKHLILHPTNDEHFITGVNLSREIKLRLQTATHTDHHETLHFATRLAKLTTHINACIPH